MAKKGSKIAVAVGAIIGAVAGVAAGILAAPKSGKETRTDIKNKATELEVEAVKDAKIVADQADRIIGQAKVVADEVVKEVGLNAADLKDRTNYAIKGAKKGFLEKK